MSARWFARLFFLALGDASSSRACMTMLFHRCIGWHVRVFSVYCVRATWADPEGRGRGAVYSLFDSVSVQVCASDSE